MTTEAASETHIRKFQDLLRELFQFDCADLDFGIYRIMNHKRDAVEKFVSEKLPAAISDNLETGEARRQAEAQDLLAQIAQQVRENLDENAIRHDGELDEPYRNTSLGQRYLAAKDAAEGARSRSDLETSIYNHLYTFFSRYYQDGDFISKRRYSRNQRYAIPYNGEEVYLHWANSDQYYVKTAEHFHNYDWKDESNKVSVRFRLAAADIEQNNVQGDKRFFLPRVGETRWDADSHSVTIPFEYRPLAPSEKITYGNRNQQEKIIAAAVESIPARLTDAPDAQATLTRERRRDGKDQPVTHLEHHLRQYTHKNESDFFVHKDLSGFLSRELDFYLKNEVLNLDSMETAGENVAEGWFQQMRLIKSVGSQIIEFLAQIENFQKTLWEKRKFITETHYCVTLANVPSGFHPEIAANHAQWDEWRNLFDIDGSDRSDEFLQARPTLVLDTRHFDADFTDRLLASFDDLDGATDGLLIHGENWQALNLLQEKHRNTIQYLYIDPPYNSKSTEIIYKNEYKHSSWLSLIENRLTLSARLMYSSAVSTIAIDENEQERLGFLLGRLFPNHTKTCVTIVHNPGGIQGDNFSYNSEFAYFVHPTGGRFVGMQRREDTPDIRPLRDVSTGNHLRTDAANCFYPIYIKDGEIVRFGDVCDDDFHPESANVPEMDGLTAVYPIDAQGNERKWVFSRQNVDNIQDELTVQWNKSRNIWDIIRKKIMFNYKTVWDGGRYNSNSYGSRLLNGILGDKKFSFPKSLYTVMDSVQLGTEQANNVALVLDYFAGSGTTGHAVINLNREDDGQRKFILVEMGEYFDTVLLPRIKKVTFAPEWRNGKPRRPATDEEAEHSPRVIKYHRMESYEDTLDGIEFDDATGRMNLEDRIDGYLLKYMLKWETKDSDTLLNTDKLNRPFDYRLRAHVNGSARERTTDVPETFNYLLGLNVRTRRVHKDGDRRYLVYRGEPRESPGSEVAVVWRDTQGWTEDDHERDRQFIADNNLVEGADTVYANSPSIIPGAKAVEPLFYRRMFAPVIA